MASGKRPVISAFTVIFILYGALQLYVVTRVQAGLVLRWPATAAFGAWATLMTVMPLLLWRWESRGRHRAVLAGAWIGYTWMGVTFLFFWVSAALALIRAVIRLAGGHAGPSPHSWFALACFLTAAVAVYGVAAARRVRIERVSIATDKLPSDSPALRVAVISDVHLGALVGVRRLRAILERVRALAPDVLVSAGDLIDGQADRLDRLAALLAQYQPRYGKFAVTGNHEYFVGLEQALAFHGRAGFTMLRGDAVAVGGLITFAGVDDPIGKRLGVPAETDEPRLFQRCPPGRFTILVKHQPRVDDRVVDSIDLQVSGHVHKGQIFPFGLLVRLFYPLGTGLRPISDRGWLYVSRGTGTWGPPMRVAAAPEITLIEITPARQGESKAAADGPRRTR
jgi:predicted MPP superfamily phosphohydrolase